MKSSFVQYISIFIRSSIILALLEKFPTACSSNAETE